jgi:hypothetical protein
LDVLEYSILKRLSTFSDQQNATVIEQNRKLREALKEMDEAFDTPGVVNDFWLRKLIKDTLKETEHEK